MKRWIGISIVVGLGVLFLSACGAGGSSDSAVRKTVEDALKAAETGLNNHNVNGVDPFFATAAEGANADGLGQTRDALSAFAASLSGSDQVQFHDFAIQNVEVHDSAGLAKVTYQLHLSVVRSGSQLAFGATVTQDLALLRTPRGWRISGGDQPQLSDVKGQWPSR
jgi:hypothetical protein